MLDGSTIENIRYDDFRHAVYRALITPRAGTSKKDARVAVEYYMENELSYVEGSMFIAFITAYCCGVGFPAAGIREGPRDFDRASEACDGGMTGE